MYNRSYTNTKKDYKMSECRNCVVGSISVKGICDLCGHDEMQFAVEWEAWVDSHNEAKFVTEWQEWVAEVQAA
jgi:hypothetical protein